MDAQESDRFRSATLGKGLRPRCLHRITPHDNPPYRWRCVNCGQELKAASGIIVIECPYCDHSSLGGREHDRHVMREHIKNKAT
jgi:predicted RNA-binding Zn-ribbon protein involved in translation (DUF1610 family)